MQKVLNVSFTADGYGNHKRVPPDIVQYTLAVEQVFPDGQAAGLAINTVVLCHQDCVGMQPVPGDI